jgi:hypothetical protein
MYTLQAETSFKLQMLYMYHIYVHTHGILSLTHKIWYLLQSNFIVNIQHLTNCHYTISNIFFNHCSLIIHTLLVAFIFTTHLNLFFVLGIVVTSNSMDGASMASIESLHNILTLHVT